MQHDFPADDDSANLSPVALIISVLWIVSVGIAVFVGYSIGQNHQRTQQALSAATQNSLSPTVTTTPAVQTQSLQETAPLNAPPVETAPCAKEGYAQKWEYLISYTIKPNDTLQSIASSQLGDASRANEILQINGVNALVVDSTLYLPPPSVTKSSGNLKEVYGKLVSKDPTAWRIDFSNDPKGQGILIPTFWFEKIPNKDTFVAGDCVKVFFDDGDTVYSVAMQ